MFIRTYIRTLFNDIFKNNFLIKSFVNIYYNLTPNSLKAIKFSTNIPIKPNERKKIFSFQSVTGDKIDCK